MTIYRPTFYNKELLHFIDSSLRFIRREKICSTGVFHIKKENKPYILKIADQKDEFDFGHLERDIFALSSCQSILGIPKIYNTYYKKGYLILLREFIEGEGAYKISKRNVLRLEKTIIGVHKRGFARIEINSSNVIVSRKGPYLIDLGHCLTNYDLNNKGFCESKKQDKRDLEKLAVRSFRR